jgi:two-component system, NarL family, sensor histidine kinase UhpB
MSLRIRLNLLITILFVSLFICSSFYIIANARDSVQHEVESTANLALQLIEIAFSSTTLKSDEQKQIEVLKKLSEQDLTRHLHIDIESSNDVITPDEKHIVVKVIKAPNWFVKLVTPPLTEIRLWLNNPIEPPRGVVIRADPTDEIDENWTEVKSILIFLLVFIISSNILLYFVIGKYLAPIDTILKGLTDIEKGNYELELPHFRLPELDRISQRFNHMAKVLLESKAKNQSLTKYSLEIQEEERRHLAQELHDELGQTIAAIKAIAAAVMNDKESDKNQINSSLKTIIEYSDHIYQVAKNMMHRLRPSVLDEFGLIKALQSMIDDWNSRQDNIFCHFSFSNIPSDLTELLNISFFRIVQESLTNALKYSSASKILISMNSVNFSGSNYINLNIQDDGVGLNKDKPMTGLGLPGMKERVEMNHGKFELISEVNKGLTIDISIPIKS